jgi:hypothetical protein
VAITYTRRGDSSRGVRDSRILDREQHSKRSEAMNWTVDVDVIRSAGRELYRKHFRTLSDAWAFIKKHAAIGDRFVIGKGRA